MFTLSAAFAQAPETAPSPAIDTFRVNTRLVEVEVVVHAKGKPVDDLKAEDFTIQDQGKPQRVAAFAIRRATDQRQVRPLAAGEKSNRVNSLGEEPVGATVILLDTLNSDPEDMVEMRRQLLIYLDKVLSDPAGMHDRLALYSLNKTLQIVQDFSGDPARLRLIVARWKAVSSVDVNAASLITDLPTTGDPITDGMIDASAKEMTDNANLRRAENTAFAMETIAKHLSGLPGRKKLIWAGASFSARTSDVRSRNGMQQIEIRNYSEFIDKSVRALNEAHVAVYPIDPRNPCKNGCSTTSSGFMATGIETMNLFAGGTGGKAFYVVSDIASVINEAIEDSEVTYALGFYPDSSKLDGKFHTLKVKVARDGLDVRHRKGYIAGDGKQPQPKVQQKSFKEAMESPLDSTGIGLSGRLTGTDLVRNGHEVLLRIDPQELQLATEQTQSGMMVWTTMVTLGTFLSAQPKSGLLLDVKLTFTEQRLKEVLRDGYLIRVPIDNKGFPTSARIGVIDRSSGRMGSLTFNIAEGEAPALAPSRILELQQQKVPALTQ